MENLTMDDVIRFAESAANTLAGKAQKLAGQSVIFAQKAGEKAKLAGQLTMVNAAIAVEKQELSDRAKKLGLRYYELCAETPQEALREETEAVGETLLQLRALREQAAVLKQALSQTDKPEDAAVKPACEEETPAEEAPVEAPVVEAPVEAAPVEEAPAEEAPVEEAPVEEAPAEEAPVEEIPVEDAPAEEIPAEKAPAGDDAE